MAKWTMRGMDDYAAFLQRIGKNTPEIIGKGIYAMAGVVADRVANNIEGLSAVSDLEGIREYQKGEKSRLTVGQKNGLRESFGITTMKKENGYYYVKLGFDGYNRIRTKKYPNGQPNAMIARITESGSSFRDKTPFIRPAVNASRNEALQRCQTAIDEEIRAIEKD